MEAAHTYKSGITKDVVRECLQQIYALSQESAATGQWTGVLPTHTPTWTKGEAFLAAWPDTLLP
jgi:hypothetical protein